MWSFRSQLARLIAARIVDWLATYLEGRAECYDLDAKHQAQQYDKGRDGTWLTPGTRLAVATELREAARDLRALAVTA